MKAANLHSQAFRFTLFGILFAAIATSGFAAEIPWKSTSYTVQVREESLTMVMQNFCADQGIVAVISENVVGKVSGKFTKLAPSDFLDQMTSAYGLIWYFDGAVLYLHPASEIQTTLITMSFAKVGRLVTALKLVELYDERFPLKTLEEEGMVYVSGPPRYVELVTQTAGGLEANAQRYAAMQSSRDVVEVIPLQYAWADDLTLTFNDRDIVVPGVVTVLRSILTGNTGLESIENRDRRRSASVGKLKGTGMRSLGAAEDDEIDPQPAPAEQQGDEPGPPQPFPMVMADVRNNAVVIRDKQENIHFYREIIETLDVPAGLIEIHASIIEVNTDFSHELGVDWRYEDEGQASGGFFATTEREEDDTFAFGNSGLTLGEGLSFTTILGDAGKNFLARIRALEADGKADIISRPSVLTLDNVEAQLETNQTFYVRLEGDREVDLFNVSAGVTLRVMPHIINDEQGAKIRMSVSLEDGNVTDGRVDNIPVVQKTTINTQAMIRDNQSLLVGGYVMEKRTNTLKKVPLLGNIPLFRHLFRHKERRNETVERLILITPRIVNLDRISLHNQITPRRSNFYDTQPLPLDPNRFELETEDTGSR
ncbi:type III secretion system outer membrane ring subunit SctC [Sulfidibacter corallicola]|uniref:Type 3 secretion system secretin n=1 Tax=Sulfidibacter corallicola TaxID=2818388 RepID=A0A8A4TPK3_SULCO|nr:type III secretion system outer membrane ring subunit SctC [Sulfidibacter corallicola]QTD51134.1 type III secretion system outer membrane ring subunit SctC [Sulfidibacter corallicola]